MILLFLLLLLQVSLSTFWIVTLNTVIGVSHFRVSLTSPKTQLLFHPLLLSNQAQSFLFFFSFHFHSASTSTPTPSPFQDPHLSLFLFQFLFLNRYSPLDNSSPPSSCRFIRPFFFPLFQSCMHLHCDGFIELKLSSMHINDDGDDEGLVCFLCGCSCV